MGKKVKKKEYLKVRYVCPLFNDDIYLMTGDQDAAENFCKGLELTDKHRGKTAEIADKGSLLPGGFLVWVDSRQNYYTMVHETLHLARIIMEYHGVPFNAENDEFIATYQTYWVKKFWHTMSKGKDNGKSKRTDSHDISRQPDKGHGHSRPGILKDGNKGDVPQKTTVESEPEIHN